MDSNNHISNLIKVDREYEAYDEKWVRLLVDKGLLKPTVDIMPYAKYLMIVELNRWLGPWEYAYHINRKWKDDRIENLKIIDTTPVDIEIKYPYDPVKYTGIRYWYKSTRRYTVHLSLKNEYSHDKTLKKEIAVSMHKYVGETELEYRFLKDDEKVIYIDSDNTNYDVDNLKVMKKGERGSKIRHSSLPLGPVPFQDYHLSFVNYPKNVYKRSRVNLLHKDDHKKDTGMHLARYLVCVDKGEWLPKHLEVHHVDNNIKNDILDNLEIITKEEHDKISYEERKEKTPKVEITCDGCNDTFEKLLCEVRRNLNNEKTKSNNIFCSWPCRSKYIQSGNKVVYKKLITYNCIICNKNINIPENGIIVKSEFNPDDVPICSMTCVNKYLSRNGV